MITQFSNPTESAICQTCEKAFEASFALVFGKKLIQIHCDPCLELAEKRQADRVKTSKAKGWDDVCPTLYAGYDFEKLPEAGKLIVPKVMAWQESSKGYGLIGDSFLGKSFILHELFRRWFEHGKLVVMVSATEFAWACGSTEQDERRNLIERMIRADMLLLDDLGKEKITERVESDLYHVLEMRRRNLKPIFVTVNSSGEELKKKLSADGGDPILNRIRDICEILPVRSKTQI